MGKNNREDCICLVKYAFSITLKFYYVVGIGAGNAGLQGPGDDRRGPIRDFDERGGKTVLLVSELNAEVCITFLCYFPVYFR